MVPMIELDRAENLLRKSLKDGGDFAELFFEHTKKTLSIFENKCLEEFSSGTDQGIGLRVIDHLNTVYGFTNKTEPSALDELTAALKLSRKNQGVDKKIRLKKQEAKILFPIQIALDSIAAKTKLKMLVDADAFVRSLDTRIKQVRFSYRETLRRTQIVASDGTFADSNRNIIDLIVSITASNGKEMASSAEVLSGHGGFEIFAAPIIELMLRDVARQALQNLTAPQAPGGRMPVVIASSAGGTLIHEAVGHGLEADLVNDELSVFRGKLGKKVASPLVTVIDDATLAGKRGSFSFDDEGTPSQRTVLIENGTLKNYMCDKLTAMKMGIAPTGNARRESYEYHPIVRMTNTFLAPGKDDPEGILKNTPCGLFVAKMGGGQVNTVNGDFVFEVNEAYLIKNGRLGNPVKNATLSGNALEVLKSIDKIGNDLGFSSGTCGKDNQDAPVTDAMPTIRVPEMVVGGKVE